MLLQQQANQPQQKEYEVGENEIVEGKHLSSYDKKINELNERLKNYELRSKYPDMDKVLTADNIQQFSKLYPELAGPLDSYPISIIKRKRLII